MIYITAGGAFKLRARHPPHTAQSAAPRQQPHCTWATADGFSSRGARAWKIAHARARVRCGAVRAAARRGSSGGVRVRLRANARRVRSRATRVRAHSLAAAAAAACFRAVFCIAGRVRGRAAPGVGRGRRRQSRGRGRCSCEYSQGHGGTVRKEGWSTVRCRSASIKPSDRPEVPPLYPNCTPQRSGVLGRSFACCGCAQ